LNERRGSNDVGPGDYAVKTEQRSAIFRSDEGVKSFDLSKSEVCSTSEVFVEVLMRLLLESFKLTFDPLAEGRVLREKVLDDG
jgi:hypothetical protein